MKYTRKYRGFTLLELLVTSALFVVIAGLTTSIFAGVSKLQISRKGSQALAGQLRQAEQQFKDDFQNGQVYTSIDPTVKIVNNSSDRTNNSVLFIRRNVLDATGATQSEWRVYCLNNNELLRFRLPFTQKTSPPMLLPSTTSVACQSVKNATSLESAFNNGGFNWGTASADEITDTQSTASNLTFTQLQGDPASVDPAFSSTFNALRVEMSAQDSSLDPSSAPIVLRIDLNRLTQ